MTPLQKIQVEKLSCFGLTTPDASRLGRFYQRALGFRPTAANRRSGSGFEALMGLEGSASSLTLCLGSEVIELLQFDRPGRPYPANASAPDLCFQHFAIVVTDIRRAYERLSSVHGWMPISTDGPQKLPAASGGVTAFKFRDPDGHPLELLAFPDGKLPERWRAGSKRDIFLGIDHSAISVSDSQRSAAFYEALGLRIAARSLNTGPEQERLDAVSGAQVEVTALEPEQTAPHVELLCYRSATRARKIALRNNDVAASRLVFEADGPSPEAITAPRALVDPDGHHLVIAAPINACSRTEAIAIAGSSPASVKPESAP